MRLSLSSAAAAVALLCGTGAALAVEYPIGEPQFGGDMEISAVYLQPIEMEPAGMMRPAADSDVHLEADIKATADNKNGFADGDWVPYLVVDFELTKIDSKETVKGTFMPMVANDGPHYGDNVKLFGPGKYKLSYTISPPTANKNSHFHRHTDKETGVAEWFKPFTVDYEFTYAGTGKKGGY